MLVGDNQISVAISNPPRRNQQQTESDKTSTVTSSLGSGAVKSGYLINLTFYFIKK